MGKTRPGSHGTRPAADEEADMTAEWTTHVETCVGASWLLVCFLRLRRLATKPYVNPPSALVVDAQLGLSAAALGGALMGVVAETGREPHVRTVSAVVTALAWLGSVAVLVSGIVKADVPAHRRVVRVWWFVQLVVGAVVAGVEQKKDDGMDVRLAVRWFVVACSAVLCATSLLRVSSAAFRYEEVDMLASPLISAEPSREITPTIIVAPVAGSPLVTPAKPMLALPPPPTTTSDNDENVDEGGEGNGNAEDEEAPRTPSPSSTSTPPQSAAAATTTTTTTTTRPRTIVPSQLSETTLYGAHNSAFRDVMEVWETALAASSAPREAVALVNDNEKPVE